MFSIYLVCVSIISGTVTGWTYPDQDHWASLCQTGTQQSPIPLSHSVSEDSDFPPFSIYGYGQNISILVKNNGHSAEVRQKTRTHIPEISGGGLPEVYQLDHLHFHWKSEHTIENYRFPLEMHLVHYAKRFGSTQGALKHPGGVAVFAVLFDLSPDDVQDFDPLLAEIATIQTKLNVPDELEGFVIKNYLPIDLAGFYRYNGSLTTPNCTEGIIWTVFTNTIPISKQQVEIFEKMRTVNDVILEQNYRSLQDINGRNVQLKVSPLRFMAGGSTINVATFSLIFLTCIITFT
ncbi:putative carbonic anhydrase 3 [Diorhabda carinulata]|uniref:putative carbonic anhydrase 3 n=1 Tax=Diorhabda carinulata TaxID=1163345 RepID=UPI0025A0D882|nr:putative carbonic anhydrase 3 [Diorhabda carinulata]